MRATLPLTRSVAYSPPRTSETTIHVRTSIITAALFGLLAAIACGLPDTDRVLDSACDDSSQCESGLQCLPYSDRLGTCETEGLKCSRRCVTDADCLALLGEGYACFKACDDTLSCGFTTD